MSSDDWGGSGVIPYALDGEEAYFLFQETKGGKKEGTLVDFGGARDFHVDHTSVDCAAREFVEETAGLLTTDAQKETIQELAALSQSEIESSVLVKKEISKVRLMVQESKLEQKVVVTSPKNGNWYESFLVRIPYSNLSLVSDFFAKSTKRKARILYWVPRAELVKMLRHGDTFRGLVLHPRVTSLIGLENLVETIVL